MPCLPNSSNVFKKKCNFPRLSPALASVETWDLPLPPPPSSMPGNTGS